MMIVNLDWENFQRRYSLGYNDFELNISKYNFIVSDLEMKNFEVFVYRDIF